MYQVLQLHHRPDVGQLQPWRMRSPVLDKSLDPDQQLTNKQRQWKDIRHKYVEGGDDE